MITAGPILAELRIQLPRGKVRNQYPLSIPIIHNLKKLTFTNQVTFLVGENGTGKSTILEALATKSGFGLEGGSKNINFQTGYAEHYQPAKLLSDAMTLSWRQKPKHGYFFRAESFFNVATKIDAIAKEPWGDIRAYDPYGGISLHEQSHGESFLAFFKNQTKNGGFFIFDEPEAALSPQRQLALMILIHEATKQPHSQFIIATHSPILLAYPGAIIYSCDGDKLTQVEYKDTEHYQITKTFLDNPEQYIARLFE